MLLLGLARAFKYHPARFVFLFSSAMSTERWLEVPAIAANKHPFVGKKEPVAVDPTYVLEHFPDIECPMVNVLRHVSQTSCAENATEKFVEDATSEDCAVLAELIQPPTTVYHALVAECHFPIMKIREKEHHKLMPPERAHYYESNVKCTDAVYLCALTKGQARNARLETQCSDLSQQVKEHEGRLVQLEQHSRVANLEIKGVPFRKEEDLTEVIARIGEAIQEPVTPADIEVVHRVPTAKSRTVKNIVVQFAGRKKRDVFLEKARPVRLTGSDLGFDSQAPVFINEHP
ncbi:hypothetical protein HPB48_021087 [Haemaphysalis longicornis]|uniref:Uncharacterized protein n=1 Tax=Haemaphysalis longicornis TaxID=44386 RepID=A0A9J6GMZ7_HAELO|nr:hypothetical protein HPB48_021087 [Haemaphysalis longicornis]